jgi:hypothetical protein
MTGVKKGKAVRRFVIEILLVVVIAVVSGGGSALFALDQARNRGTMAIGPWTAAPDGGGNNPYAAAIAATTPDLPFGTAEGIVFTARSDSDGRSLTGRCGYVISGQTPPARLWTLTVYDGNAELMANAASRTGFHSREILRQTDGQFAIAVSPFAQPGNWVPVDEDARLIFMLRLYDTPLTTGLAAAEQTMPTITAEACR